MKKINRSYQEAEAIAERKTNLYVQMVNIMFASEYDFDEDQIEAALEDNNDSVLYFETQNKLKAIFSIHRDVFVKFANIRHTEGIGVRLTPIFERLSSKLRTKSYNERGTASYKVGAYSKMYIYNPEAFYDICSSWHKNGDDDMFDFNQPMYDLVREEFIKRHNPCIMDYRKSKRVYTKMD